MVFFNQIKIIQCPTAISEKEAQPGYLMDIQIVLDLVWTKILRCKTEFQLLHFNCFEGVT